MVRVGSSGERRHAGVSQLLSALFPFRKDDTAPLALLARELSLILAKDTYARDG